MSKLDITMQDILRELETQIGVMESTARTLELVEANIDEFVANYEEEYM